MVVGHLGGPDSISQKALTAEPGFLCLQTAVSVRARELQPALPDSCPVGFRLAEPAPTTTQPVSCNKSLAVYLRLVLPLW